MYRCNICTICNWSLLERCYKKGAIYAVIVSVILALLNMIGILTVFDRILVPIIGGSITIFIVSKFSKKKKKKD